MENKVELKCETCKNYNKYCCMWNEVYCDPGGLTFYQYLWHVNKKQIYINLYK